MLNLAILNYLVKLGYIKVYQAKRGKSRLFRLNLAILGYAQLYYVKFGYIKLCLAELNYIKLNLTKVNYFD